MDWTKVIVAFFGFITALAEVFLIPWLKSKNDSAKIEKMLHYVDIGVAAAQQIYSEEQGAEKKKYVQDFLASKGYNINMTEVDAAIESAVIKLHNELTQKAEKTA